MGEHTPGPWKVVGTEIWGANVKIASGRGAYDEKDRQKNKANARLIAAAPDLLEAAKGVLEIVRRSYRSDDRGPGDRCSKLEDAIAKAEEAP